VQTRFSVHAPFEPAVTSVHVAPPGQTWHGPPQASAQQIASDAQKPLAQPPASSPPSQSCPFPIAHV
jgi:hypothetical protein